MFIRRQPALDPDRLVFIDETWATTNMTRRYGRAARGLRLLASVPHGHWKVTTLVAGLRQRDHSAMRLRWRHQRRALPRLCRADAGPTLRPDNIVLLDNLSSHKIAGIAEAIAAQGAQLIYLPPYSPDLNPIEQAFAKFKAVLRQAGNAPARACGRPSAAPSTSSAAECRNFFIKAGYAT